MQDLVIVGAGGFGREVLWQIRESTRCVEKHNVIGFADDDSALKGRQINNYPVLGDLKWLMNYPKEICAAICVANPSIRKSIYELLRSNSSISFPAIIADNVRYSDSVKFGQGCIVCLSTTLTVNVTLGDFVIVNPHCGIGHDATLEDFVTLYWNVNIAGGVHLSTRAEIGSGTNIIPGKVIGENAVIGAGSVVVKDIPPNCTAVGVPAVPKKRR